MLKAAVGYIAIALVLVIAAIAQHRSESQRAAMRYTGRSRVSAEDTQ